MMIAKIVFQSKSDLEYRIFLHPRARVMREAFFKAHNNQLAFVEINLLFEKNLKLSTICLFLLLVPILMQIFA